MITKTYGIYGRTTAILRIPTGKGGKATIEVEFNRGIPNAGPNYRPATYATSDPVIQSILERSSLFGTMYKIVSIVGTDESSAKNAKAAPAKPAPVKKDIEPLEGITTKEEAVAFLKSKGAKATNLKDDESIKKYAEKIGVSFPNLYN